MVSRSLTEVYVLMRNNAIHSRQIFLDQGNDSNERVRLMHMGSQDLENGRSEYTPPPWTDTLEEAHYIISRLRRKITELQEHQERQIHRPALDDASDQENIERLATEIGRQFMNAHRNCSTIKSYARQGTKSDMKLVHNVITALVTTLQDLSVTFRTAQANYLKSLTSREERSKALFDLPNFEELSLNTDLLPELNDEQTDLLFSLPSTSRVDFEDRQVQQQKMLLIQEDNTKMVAEREEAVNKIVNSIVDLNDIFKDLATMVNDQGTVLDRIDYNIEQTQYQVEEGFKQLKKADQYQRKNRKMHCILILACVVVVMSVLLIVVKS